MHGIGGGSAFARDFRPGTKSGCVIHMSGSGFKAEAPAGAEKLKVKLAEVHIEGGLADMAEATRKITGVLAHRTVTAAQIFAAARELEAEYARAGYALVRVVLPAQKLTNGATGETVGTYAIGQGTLSDAANGNYDISYVGTDFSIGKRAITVTANAAQGKTYGDSDPSSLAYTVSDLGHGAALVGTLDRASGENVGTYAIGRGTLSDAANGNYDISYVGADFSIAKRAVTITANSDQGKVYGDADPSSYAYTNTDLGSGEELVGELGRAVGENAGDYAIDQGTLTDTNNANYAITFVGGDFSIARRVLTVRADAKSRPQGEANPPLTYTIGGLGLVAGDNLTGALSTNATTASAPGSYAIEQGSLNASANYDLTYVGASLVVRPSDIVVTPNGVGSIVAYNAMAHGSGAPLPVRFSGVVPGADPQTVVEDPRFDEATFCRSVGTISTVCVLASAEQAGAGQ